MRNSKTTVKKTTEKTEIIPESDKFIYGHSPRIKLDLEGHFDTAEQICKLFNNNKAPHGFLLIGKQGIGKATFVYHLIRALERKGNSIIPEDIYNTEKDIIYRRIEILSHGNLKVLRRQYNHKTGKLFQSIRMEDIRDLKPFFEFKPHGDGKRYVIIDSLDDCVHGQNSVPNAILKTLEEPPENCYFFILAHKEGIILPTIKSRCRSIYMTAPTEQELKNIIGTIHNFKSDNLDKAIQMADGSIRMAMIYADNLWFSVFNSIKKSLFKSLPANNVFPAQILKDKYFDGSLTHSEYMFVLHLLCSKAIADNAKFSASHGHHTSAFASGIIFDKIHELFIKAEEYNFTAQEVIERVIAHLDYYHYIKQEVTYGS